MASFPLFYDFVSWRRKLCNYKMKVVNVSESTYLPIQFAKSFLRIISSLIYDSRSKDSQKKSFLPSARELM